MPITNTVAAALALAVAIAAAPAPLAAEAPAALQHPDSLGARDAAPAPTLAPRQGLINAALGAADSVVSGLEGDASELNQVFSAYAGVLTAQAASSVAPSEPSEVISIVSNILQPTGISKAVADALSPLDDAIGPNGAFARASHGQPGLPNPPSGTGDSPLNKAGGVSILDVAVEFLANSINPFSTFHTFVAEQFTGAINGFININPRHPFPPAYPSAFGDAPYDLSEIQLGNAIHIPESFTYGQKHPVILVPGTGSDGGDNFAGNMIPLLTNVDYADPVWLNIPGYMLDDIQNNAEYITYAVHYIYGITGQKQVSLVTWSQGGLAAQWALKYWPSMRDKVTNLLATSPDYAGTVQAFFLNPAFPTIPSEPSILQQTQGSKFIQTLRANGGDRPYVPTTNIYSSFFDEIVQPQTGTEASAYLEGASNNGLQTLCPGLPAGSFYTHEGVLYNPVTFALIQDSLINGGQADASRISLDELCPLYTTQGLDVEDVLSTEATIPQAAVNLLLYEPKMLQEPAIKAYAA